MSTVEIRLKGGSAVAAVSVLIVVLAIVLALAMRINTLGHEIERAYAEVREATAESREAIAWCVTTREQLLKQGVLDAEEKPNQYETAVEETPVQPAGSGGG